MAKKQSKAWSMTGAARSAREARIATVAYLQTAPIARTWEMGKLLQTHRLQLAHLAPQGGNEATATALLFGGMGYRPPYPTDVRSAAEMVLADEARYLAEAELYVISPQMCDVVIAAAQTLTLQDLELLDEQDLPSLTGLVVLPHPIIVRTIGGDLADDRAFTWRFPSQIQHPTKDRRGMEDRPAVRMSAYHDSYGPVRPDTFLDFAAQARAQGTPLPPLLLDAIRCVPLRYTATDEQLHTLEKFINTARQRGQQDRHHLAASGLNEDRVEGHYVSGDPIDDHDDSFMPRFLYALWRLCEQRIATVEHAPVNHSAQVLSERAGVAPQVRVVRLRRAEQPRSDPAQGRDWQHRWVVRMHKVRQWYPTLQQHKVIYRGPYIKGPDDKPLLGGETVRGLNR
ncbi:hypothetical protein [Herbidospora cretacea]|uniref:hypothetical protein n=1 Tax=Herbidospora cretacea TaxID=28444 RepID=UPI0004C33192|nr:hypothetical protein [Herbidospora cretacea]